MEQDDLEATYACLKAWGEDSKQKRLFAFFNSGDHSGASQPHRHLQFLPVERMRDCEAANGWELLIDLILGSTREFLVQAWLGKVVVNSEDRHIFKDLTAY